ncbi:LOW QUALITY PROTEIN: hypothetical protein Cgig2_001305 [Carnegiea gigantea]|uniref:Uncharacterized protein n=1 Tax=Carnegiea gigantea TaxID=171969 RepID=A0A9Q1JTJ0_9CARY|nr:LOW QUALITY PROTEIN: hypothetical protein Cgig2_001305 [Carnegiea gigantea]
MNWFKINMMLKLMEMLSNRILSIKLSRNNLIRNPSAIQLDPNLQDPLFIQIEMRSVVIKENRNRHLGCETSLQKFPFQMCQGSLKLCAGFTKYKMHTGWGTGTMARHLETHGILKDSGISLNQAQISGFPGAKPGAGQPVPPRIEPVNRPAPLLSWCGKVHGNGAAWPVVQRGGLTRPPPRIPPLLPDQHIWSC